MAARDQPVAKPCPAIPALPEAPEESVEAVEVPGVPSVDDIHTRIAEKLRVKNAIALGSSAGVSNGGRVGLPQVSVLRFYVHKVLAGLHRLLSFQNVVPTCAAVHF
jgi:hypothetical protein